MILKFLVWLISIFLFLSIVFAVQCGDGSGANCDTTCDIKVYLYDSYGNDTSPSGTRFVLIDNNSGSCNDTSAFNVTFNSNDMSNWDNSLCYSILDESYGTNYYYAWGRMHDYNDTECEGVSYCEPTAYIYLFNSTSITCQNPLNITLLDSAGTPANNTQITVYESGTSTIACQGNTSSSGQLKCSLNSSKTYDISAYSSENFLAYDIAIPRAITLYYSLPVGITTLISFQGKLADSSNVLVDTASFRVTVKDEGDNTKWGPHTFNNTVSSGIYNLLLGETNSLYLIPNSRYKILLEIDIENATFGTADVTYGDNSPSGDIIWFMG